MKYFCLLFIFLLFGCNNDNENIVVSQSSPPSAPLNLSITPLDMKAELSWSVPQSNGGSEIFEYSIYRGLSNTNLSIMTVISSSSTIYTDTNLVNGTTYYYAVTARNSYGEGSRSNIESAVPYSQFASILAVDSLGNLLGGDYTDWCLETTKYKQEVTASFISSNNKNDGVVLTYFSSQAIRSNVILNWGTSSENNCANYYIERTNFGSSNYEFIGIVAGSGTISEPRDYQFTSKYNQTGVYNYRLKEVDLNGNFEYFNLNNEVEIGIPSRFSFGPIFRNPVISISKLNIGLPQDDIVSVFFINGSDTNFVLRNQFLTAGYKIIYIDKYALGYNNVFKRVYIKCSTFNSHSDCRNYGDVEFR